MRALAMVAEVTRERSGGAIVSLIDQLNRHGDPYVAELLGTLVHAAATPLFEIMSRWATTGELEDLHGEFFIEEIRADGSPLAALSWSDQFVLRPERVPTCITEALAQRIYNLGRSVGFIRRFGDRPKWALKDNGNAVDIVYCDGIKLEGTIDRLAQAIHKRLVRVVLDQHRVVDHLRAAKDYLLMGQGDFVQSLMDLVFVELSRPAADISRHHLTSLLDSAIRSSTAQYDLQPCVQRLQVRLLQSSPADVGWDVFTLDYRTDDAPLSLLFPSEIRTAYLQIFRFMFRLKRIEHCLSDTWIRHNTDAARLATLPELARLFHRGSCAIT
uniref:Uncharacterized protein n=1 Tax=Spongospora subterranea TaxID=70186 RepID=A0A0H5RCX3_9EUKA|eukprot:CRZ06364.1 hypothetical protein [Spongospora subterranea]